MLDNGELQLLLLHFIDEKARHGYDLMRAFEDLTHGAYAPSPGVVYPTLTLLKDMGLVTEAEGDGARKLFSITSEGKAHLGANGETVDALLKRFGVMARLRERVDAAPVRRAMQSLRAAIFEKLAGKVSRETVLDVAGLIDDAAHKIERL